MRSSDLLVDAFGRIRERVHQTLPGLTQGQLALRPDPEANSIAWLVWHLTRVIDDHLADAAGTSQIWTADGWNGRFDLPFAASATGYGQDSAEVAALGSASEALLLGYHDAVHAKAVDFVSGVKDEDLSKIVDRRWDPPVTLGVRLVSVIDDSLEHVGQAAYLRGLIERGLEPSA